MLYFIPFGSQIYQNVGVHNNCHIANKWETEKVLDIMDVVGPILNTQYTLATYMDSYILCIDPI